jgi:hypothetical protein
MRETAQAQARHTSEFQDGFISQPPRLITCPTEARHLSDRGSQLARSLSLSLSLSLPRSLSLSLSYPGGAGSGLGFGV